MALTATALPENTGFSRGPVQCITPRTAPAAGCGTGRTPSVARSALTCEKREATSERAMPALPGTRSVDLDAGDRGREAVRAAGGVEIHVAREAERHGAKETLRWQQGGGEGERFQKCCSTDKIRRQ